ncbi:MAG: DUF2721 domain-containing protein [Lentisphaeraceae bacterium]|nr:DUF2721 domain-containing protein [Lentisphaeraceae bacterium]
MFEELKEILQAATAPMVLISGTGIFLLTINARFTHAVGRIWDIDKELTNCPDDSTLKAVMELLVIRYSLGMLVCSVISSGILMIIILLAKLFNYENKVIALILLCISCLLIVVSMVLLFADVMYSSKATMLKVGRKKTNCP